MLIRMISQVLSKMKDDTEKEHAFRGMAKMALVNPQVPTLSMREAGKYSRGS